MSTEHNDEETIFYAALELKSQAERAAYIKKACADDSSLLNRVQILLRAHGAKDKFLEVPEVQSADPNVTLDDPPRIDGPGTKIGRYELLEQIGEGGMGLVYMAQQKKPVKRKVALKIIKPGMDSKQVIARFEAEKQALAVLDHPNIAHVFDAGTTKTGRPYFIMEYVKGMSITRYCDENKLDIEKRLRLFEQVCEGIHHAHQKGIIHRDLKPSNILVSVHGDRAVPKIIDFGIAKAVTQPLTEKTFVTFQGQLLGTPEYMSPEQVDMATQDIDTRSDIYSLGVVLYELLAGVLPFEREAFASLGFAEVQRTIREQEPASPSNRLTGLGEKAKTIAASRDTHVVALARRLHRELEWIPLKAMRKDRCRRYKSASEMADDVRNYLNGNPLTAGPETAMYRMQKFVRKHAGSVATVALVAVAIVLGLIVSTAMYLRSEKALQREAVARVQAEDARVQAEEAKDKETVARTRAEQAEEVAQEQRKLAEESAENYRRGLYVNTIQLADSKYREGNIRDARKLIESCPQDLRAWEWDRINHVLDQSLMTFIGHQDGGNSMAVSTDGKSVVAGGGYEGTIRVWDITTGKELVKLLRAHRGWWVTCTSFSPDGKRIVSSDDLGVIKVWDAASFDKPITSIKHGNSIYSVAFSPDGKQLVSASDGSGEIRVWDATTGAEISTFDGSPAGVSCVAFSPDGKHIVSGDWDGIIRIRNATSGNEVTKFTGNKSWMWAISFSSDGKLLASAGGSNEIWICDATTGAIVKTLRGHDGSIRSIAFGPDDNYLVSGADDCTVMVWDIVGGEDTMTLRGHEGSATSVAFTPDGKQIVSGSRDGTVKVWDATLDHEGNRFLGHKGVVCSIAFSPDGKQLVSHSQDGKVKVWDVASAAEVMTFSGGGGGLPYNSTAFSPDGKRIASLNGAGAIRVWNAETGVQVTTLGGQDDRGYCLAFSPDSERVVSGSRSSVSDTFYGEVKVGEVKVWDVARGEEILTWDGDGRGVYSVAFSPDGKRIVSGHRNGKVKMWDAASGAELIKLIGHKGGFIGSVAFSPDSKRIASACLEDHTIKIWNAVTGMELTTLQGHGAPVLSVAFSPDGKRLVTGGRDGTARVWDFPTSAELLTLRAESGVMCVAFSPDGRAIAGGTLGKTIVLWDSAVPAGGYGPRKTTAAARKIVDELYEKHGFYHDVIDELKAAKTLDEPVSKVALQIANSRKGGDAERLNKESWEIVSSADKDMDAYKPAMEKAQKAASLEPDTLAILTTLGVGQYRVGVYADALETLKHAEKVRRDANLESDPTSVAFIAMSQHQLGQVEEGRSAMNTLRDKLEKITLDDIKLDKLSGSYRIEAEKVFAGTDEQLVAIWELISTSEVDRAVEMFTELRHTAEETGSEFAFSLEGVAGYLSRACYARGKSCLLDKGQGYVNRAADYEAGIRIDPNYVSAIKDLAWLRGTCAVEEVRDPTRAVELGRMACELTDWKNHECLSVLAGAYSESERFTDAVKRQQEAIGLLSGEDQTKWGGDYAERLRIYQLSRPYSTGERWSFTKGKIVAAWDYIDVEDGVVNNHVVGGLEGRLVDGAEIVVDPERGNVLAVYGKGGMECRRDAAFDISGAISVGAWVKPRSLTKDRPHIISKSGWALRAVSDSNSVMFGVVIERNEEYLQGLFSEPYEYPTATGDVDLTDESWHHIAGTYDGERVCLYIDGKLGNFTQVHGNIVLEDSVVFVGDFPKWGGGAKDYSWNGLIDDVRIYSYAWSAEEVKGLYEGREPPREK